MTQHRVLPHPWTTCLLSFLSSWWTRRLQGVAQEQECRPTWLRWFIRFGVCAWIGLCGWGCASSPPADPPTPVPTGRLRWIYKLGDSVSAAPTLAEKLLYIGGWDGQLHAVSQETGQPAWTFKTADLISSAVFLTEDSVYLASHDNHVYALNAQTGEFRWKYRTQRWISATPQVVDGKVYVASQDKFLYVLDANTGQLRWKWEAEAPLRGHPALQGSLVVIADIYAKLYALDTEGKLLWQHKLEGHILESVKHRVDPERLKIIGEGWVVAAPVISEDTVFFVTAKTVSGSLHAMSRETGKEKWHTVVPGQIEGSPVIAEGVIYAGSNDFNLYAFDEKTGETRWKFTTGNIIIGSPHIDGERVYVTSSDGFLYVLHKRTGQLIWKYQANNAIYSSPRYHKGTVYFGCMDENLYAVQEP